MGNTYTRQSSYSDGDVITAAHTNDEFNQLLAAFQASSGHTHDGTANEGGPITKMLGTSLTLGDGTAGTDITVTFDGETSDGVLKWMEDEDYFEFSDDILVASTEKLQFRDTAIYLNSSTDGQLDIVADTEVQIAATTIDINGNADISGNLGIGGNLTVTGTTTFNGGTMTLGDAATDNVVFGADVNSAIIPNTDNTYALGSSSQQWKDIYINGTAYLDAIDFNGTAISATAAELNLTDGAVANNVVGGKAAVYGTTGQLTASALTANTLTVASTVALNGPVTLGDATGDDITFTGRVASTIDAKVDSSYDLGSADRAFRAIYVDSVDLSGQGRILLDADLDTFIHSEVDDAMVFTAGGKPVMTISASAVLPGKNNAYDLGSDAFEWKDLYVDGVAYVDSIDLAGTSVTSTAAEINF